MRPEPKGHWKMKCWTCCPTWQMQMITCCDWNGLSCECNLTGSETMAKQCVRVGITRNNVIFVYFFGGGKGSKKIRPSWGQSRFQYWFYIAKGQALYAGSFPCHSISAERMPFSTYQMRILQYSKFYTQTIWTLKEKTQLHHVSPSVWRMLFLSFRVSSFLLGYAVKKKTLQVFP